MDRHRLRAHLGGFLLLGGELADRIGRRKVFMTGAVPLAFASLLGGIAQSHAAVSTAAHPGPAAGRRERARGPGRAAGGRGGPAGPGFVGQVLNAVNDGWDLAFLVAAAFLASAGLLMGRLVRVDKGEAAAALEGGIAHAG